MSESQKLDENRLSDFWKTPLSHLIHKLNSTHSNLAFDNKKAFICRVLDYFYFSTENIFTISQVSDLIDTVLECFLKRCAEVRFGSSVVEILADTAVALASANVRMVARIIISRLCSVSVFRHAISPVLSKLKLSSTIILFGNVRLSSKRVSRQLRPSNNTFCGEILWFCPDICLCYRLTIVWT